jgi:very-short-patch-repair endonuclease
MLIDLGIVFIPQHPVDRCILDFYLPDLDMVIECDGDYWHSLPGAKRRDQKRDYWLQSKGYIVIRISETDIKADCRRAVLDALAVRNRVVAVRAARSAKETA